MQSIEELDLGKRYTYADYLQWSFDEAVELIRGKVFRMAPAPNRRHQEVSSNIMALVGHFLWKSNCKVFHAPFDVRLPLPPQKVKNNQIDTVVQPDICVVCDTSKLDEHGCIGPPDWIVEILSASTSKKDLREKYDIYQYAGVPEYWVIHPYEETLQIFRLNDEGIYVGEQRPYVKSDKVNIKAIPGLELSLEDVFAY